MEYKQILESGEKVFWEGGPARKTWILKGFGSSLFGIVWLAFVLPISFVFGLNHT